MAPRPDKPGGRERATDPEYARAETLAHVAREVDELRRAVEPLRSTPGRVDDLTRAVADLADVVTEGLNPTPTRPAPTPPPSWLTISADVETVVGVLKELCEWLYRVYLRYSDASLPECWLWHPEVVEELLWLRYAWLDAYQRASVQAAGDWHDRQRPGVVRRIKDYALSCSRERHQTRTGWDTAPQPARLVPGVDASMSIAAWWAAARDHAAPEPPPDPGGIERDWHSQQPHRAPNGAAW